MLNLHPAEADALAHHFEHTAPTVLQRHFQRAEVGGLGRPGLYIVRLQAKALMVIVGPTMAVVEEHRLSVLIDERHFEPDAFGLVDVYGVVYPAAFLIHGIVVGVDSEIGDVHLRTGIEIDFAGNAGKAPEVLVFQIGTVAPAHHLHGNEVAAALQIFRDVELGGHLRVFAISHIASVDPHHEVARGRTHMEVDVVPLPVLRQIEGAAIGTRIVVGLGHLRRIILELLRPGIADILIDAVAIAIELEQARNGKVAPLRVVEVYGKEVLRCLIVVFCKAETPLAFHRKVARRLAFVVLCCEGFVFKSKEGSAARLAILLVHLRIEPHGHLVGPS